MGLIDQKSGTSWSLYFHFFLPYLFICVQDIWTYGRCAKYYAVCSEDVVFTVELILTR